MAKFNQQPNKTSAGSNFGTEFASETNAAEVRKQNARSAQGGASGSFGTEFASETNASEVRQQNQQAESKKSKNAGQFGQS